MKTLITVADVVEIFGGEIGPRQVQKLADAGVFGDVMRTSRGMRLLDSDRVTAAKQQRELRKLAKRVRG